MCSNQWCNSMCFTFDSRWKTPAPAIITDWGVSGGATCLTFFSPWRAVHRAAAAAAVVFCHLDFNNKKLDRRMSGRSGRSGSCIRVPWQLRKEVHSSIPGTSQFSHAAHKTFKISDRSCHCDIHACKFLSDCSSPPFSISNLHAHATTSSLPVFSVQSHTAICYGQKMLILYLNR